MNKKKGIALVAGLSAYVGALALLGVQKDADAAWRDVHAGVCHHGTDDAGSAIDNRGEIKNTGSTTRQVYCPVISDSTLNAANITTLWVDGNEGTNGASSRACSAYIASAAFLCGTSAAWSNNFGNVAVPSVSEWGDDSVVEYRYVRHDLTQNSSVYGMSMTD